MEVCYEETKKTKERTGNTFKHSYGAWTDAGSRYPEGIGRGRRQCQCYLFTAKSGTGKSTHARLWRETFGDRAVRVNDDKPLLRITKEGVTAYGTPWDGKHRLSTNTSVPLKGICIIERAADNRIVRLDTKEQLRSAYPMMVQQTHKSSNPANARRTMELIDRLMEAVPIYRLSCNMEPEAAKVAYEGMQNE